jgi:hypothetical protein
MWLIVKALISATVIFVASELWCRVPRLGALLLSTFGEVFRFNSRFGISHGSHLGLKRGWGF